jgi:hypothetical protein
VVSKEPTRFHANVPSLIDFFMTGLVRTFSQLAFPGMNTGHDLLYGYYRVCHMTEDGPTPNVWHYRDYKSIDVERLFHDVLEQDWTPIFNLPDVKGQVCYFNDLVLSLFERYVPWRRFRDRKCPRFRLVNCVIIDRSVCCRRC